MCLEKDTGNKGRQPVGIGICKDEKRKGGAEPSPLIHNLQLGHTEEHLSSLLRCDGWRELEANLRNNSGCSPRCSVNFYGVPITCQAVPGTEEMTVNQTGKPLAIREPP